jgi:uncharacterized UBP type Zn finger protein
MSNQETIGDRIARVLFQRSFRRRECSHLDLIEHASPKGSVCGGCEQEGTQPFHLRKCLVCGEVGCCDSSKAKHARRHFEETGHALIRSVEPSERWSWCYIDKAYLADVLD